MDGYTLVQFSENVAAKHEKAKLPTKRINLQIAAIMYFALA